ncbi:hypothetical protein EJ06DRAFT_553333 [Trichodelitschia bisporula]|uniref:Uncharacterized protein n=1 Tax=Trichodelitschia bisporula TaxID=703511 RepID=A0A6G1I8D8_9PEZI|nr:hypothetical protein EJ06DRAFT_553333 [Trichodelitschia bisporula]
MSLPRPSDALPRPDDRVNAAHAIAISCWVWVRIPPRSPETTFATPGTAAVGSQNEPKEQAAEDAQDDKPAKTPKRRKTAKGHSAGTLGSGTPAAEVVDTSSSTPTRSGYDFVRTSLPGRLLTPPAPVQEIQFHRIAAMLPAGSPQPPPNPPSGRPPDSQSRDDGRVRCNSCGRRFSLGPGPQDPAEPGPQNRRLWKEGRWLKMCEQCGARTVRYREQKKSRRVGKDGKVPTKGAKGPERENAKQTKETKHNTAIDTGNSVGIIGTDTVRAGALTSRTTDAGLAGTGALAPDIPGSSTRYAEISTLEARTAGPVFRSIFDTNTLTASVSSALTFGAGQSNAGSLGVGGAGPSDAASLGAGGASTPDSGCHALPRI